MAVLAILMHPGIDAQESFLVVGDSLTTTIPFQGIYDAIDIGKDDMLYAVSGDTVYTINLENSQVQDRISVTNQSYSGFPAFLTLDPLNKDLWVGYTTYDNADDRIYKYDAGLKEWIHIATFPGNFDLALRNGQALISGLNSSSWEDPPGIWLLDDTGNDHHRLIIETGGYSAGLDIDSDGNVYYASSFFSDNALLKWDNSDVSAVIENPEDTLETMAATILSKLPAGSYDIDLDKQENILFTCNKYGVDIIESFIGIWDRDQNYDTIAISDLSLSHLSVRGNALLKDSGNQVFTMSYGTNIAEVHYDLTQTVYPPVSIESISVYPNPATGYIKICAEDLNNGVVSILDMNGRTILRQVYKHAYNAIDISSLAAGNYLLILRNDDLLYRTMIQKR